MARLDLSAFAPNDDTPVFVISVAAELAGMHAQTLRQYDRLGLVIPSRTKGGGRRYSQRDVALLREVQRLSQEEGVSLSGIARILELENRVDALRARVTELSAQVEALQAGSGRTTRVFSVSPTGDVYASRLGERPRTTRSQALVVWSPHRR
ncbi:heat shock protein transcriptional repressor HspR [Phycicoccus flavus]|uniref:heat shock protein transcriptional repressor HspR n=1 Tax=Phycicoccus flavus TaxID=2502783 RepID=UPI000FEB7AEF|nr:helix-turn-helix transcriptional regulator [Phycicoccus flavus]NHA68863.1 helix-turn-helix transcriptional regulator [Phycicoccus flavus]